MTFIKDLRASIDTGLDKLEAKAEALEAHFELTEDAIEDRIESMGKSLKEAAETLHDKISDSVSDETRTRIRASLEHLQVQLALGKAEGRDAYNEKKKQISRAIADFNAELDAAEAADAKSATSELDGAVKDYVESAVFMEAELAAKEQLLYGTGKKESDT